MVDLRIVHRGRRRLIPIVELKCWLERNAALTLDEGRDGYRFRCKEDEHEERR